MEMLQLSLKYHRETNGIFDPSILPDLKGIGYDRSMDEIRSRGVSSPLSVSNRSSRPAFTELDLNSTENRVHLPHGMEIDLGGIAKGWIVEKAAKLLHRYVRACGVSAGGDILFIGHPADGMDWDISLEDPRNPSVMLTQLHLPAGAIATSSIMKRSWSQGEKIRHHLIDPHTGEPAQTDWLSVTVITPDVITADVYAKAILIAGEKDLSTLLNSRRDLTFIAVNPQGKLFGSPNYKEYIYEFTSEPI
jgi:thiamine biosynthesis lipoprotein